MYFRRKQIVNNIHSPKYYSNDEIMAGVTLSLTGDAENTILSGEDGSMIFESLLKSQ